MIGLQPAKSRRVGAEDRRNLGHILLGLDELLDGASHRELDLWPKPLELPISPVIQPIELQAGREVGRQLELHAIGPVAGTAGSPSRLAPVCKLVANRLLDK